MKKAECIKVGRVSRLHGFKGELSLKFEQELPLDYSIQEVFFLDLNEKLVPHFVETIRFTPQGYGLTFLDGVDTEARARHLVGTDLYLPRTVLPEMAEDEYMIHELVGFSVVDETHGEVGKVTEVIEHPGNILLSVDSPEGVVLIPLIDQFVNKVDKGNRCINVSTPEGLIDLNRSDSE